ncbi:zinc ribbon domain-containing protein [Virgibacillus soli]|uniref:zinc ribbon domain-containing protein n=1 Tax=Paracerasibacillus soli TaxID=480284 RepID=UPI0035EDFA43
MVCPNCKEQIEEKDTQFCPECGTNLQETELIEKGKGNRKILITTFSILFLVISAFTIFFFIGKSKFDPEKVVASFESAVQDKKDNALLKLLKPNDDSFKMNKKDAARLIDLYQTDKDAYDDVVTKLNMQVKALQQKNLFDPTEDSVNGTLNLKQGGKKWLFFTDYYLEVTPAYIELTTNEKDIDLFINDEKVATSDKAEFQQRFGPYTPGLYEVKAAFENEYTDIEEVEQIELYDSVLEAENHYFELPLAEVEVSSAFNEVDLYINGEKTDKKIMEGNQSIGVFPTDGSIETYIAREYPWGIVQSDPLSITGNQITFEHLIVFDYEEEVALMERINDIVESYHVSLSKKDPDLFKEGITENMKNDHNAKMDQVKKKKPKYKGEFLEAVYDVHNISLPEYDDSINAFTVKLRAHYTFHEPNVQLEDLFDYHKRDGDNYTRSRELTIMYDEDKKEWKLHKYEKQHFAITERSERVFKFTE